MAPLFNQANAPRGLRFWPRARQSPPVSMMSQAFAVCWAESGRMQPKHLVSHRAQVGEASSPQCGVCYVLPPQTTGSCFLKRGGGFSQGFRTSPTEVGLATGRSLALAASARNLPQRNAFAAGRALRKAKQKGPSKEPKGRTHWNHLGPFGPNGRTHLVNVWRNIRGSCEAPFATQ